MATTNSYEYSPRDLVGYGEHVPNANWPNGAKVAISLVLNYEEGSEVSSFPSLPLILTTSLVLHSTAELTSVPLLPLAE